MTTPRFRWNVSVDYAKKLILEAYKYEVERRGRKAEITDLQLEYIKKVAIWLTEDNHYGLMINGDTGCGKTTMTMAMVDLLVVVPSLKISFRNISANTLAALARNNTDDYLIYMKAPFLFIDDIGTESAVVKSYGTEISPVEEVLSYRYANLLMTVCTSNLKRDQFNEFYGARIASRAREMFAWLSQKNPDWR